MISQVARVLEGKTGTLISSLESEMQSLASRMRFEEAASLRDRIKGLKAYSERQKAVTLEVIDRDIVAFAEDGDDACGVVFKIRDGKMIGRHHYYMSNVDGRSADEILGTLLQQYYLDAEFIPAEIIVPISPEDEGTIRDWLVKKRGDTVALGPPVDEEGMKLVRLSQSNAEFLLGELKTQRMKGPITSPIGQIASAGSRSVETREESNALIFPIFRVQMQPRRWWYSLTGNRVRTIIASSEFDRWSVQMISRACVRLSRDATRALLKRGLSCRTSSWSMEEKDSSPAR
jgi:hypothetical protein